MTTKKTTPTPKKKTPSKERVLTELDFFKNLDKVIQPVNKKPSGKASSKTSK